MSDLIVALGLMLVIEGLTFAALPGLTRRAMEAMLELSDYQMRVAGVGGALAGLLIVWLVRG
ncbi:DUF2065 domain-containing protein [Ancylobacter terrae]|uniref:DUF2065 domain-containing protein n=1 Tax=Ancylobacter sp. sgz301288 TaxID=3342077 RepID=UPI00385A9157